MSNVVPETTVGMDLGDRYTYLHVLDAAGECVEEGRLRTTPAALRQRFEAMLSARVVMEAGTHSPWVSRLLSALDHEVIVANPRQLRLIYDNDGKSDGVDAEYLARIGRLDPKLLRGPILELLEQITAQIRAYDRELEALADANYPETQMMRQVTGVGPLTSLAYALVIEDPSRFAKSRSVGAYVGLTPRRRDSGDSNPQLRITKAGSPLLRRLLVQSAAYIMGPHGPDCDLRRYGERIAERGGKNARKRAHVAVARKLAVLLHRLWVSEEAYEPLRNAKQEEAKAA